MHRFGDNRANHRQEDNRRNNMADSEKKPVGDAYAIIDPQNSRERDAKADFVHVGAVWENQDGSLQVLMFAEPIAWRSPVHSPRKIQIRFRDGYQSSGEQSRNRDRDNRRR
jgi:hypothetical protein